MLVSPDPALDRWWGQGGVSVIPGEANFPPTHAPAGFPLPLHAGDEGLAEAALTGAAARLDHDAGTAADARLDHDAGTAAASLPPLTQSEAPGAGWVPPPSPGSQPRHLHDAEHALDDTSAPRDMSHDGHVPAHAHDGAAPLGLGRLRLPAFELGPAAPALGDASPHLGAVDFDGGQTAARGAFGVAADTAQADQTSYHRNRCIQGSALSMSSAGAVRPCLFCLCLCVSAACVSACVCVCVNASMCGRMSMCACRTQVEDTPAKKVATRGSGQIDTETRWSRGLEVVQDKDAETRMPQHIDTDVSMTSAKRSSAVQSGGIAAERCSADSGASKAADGRKGTDPLRGSDERRCTGPPNEPASGLAGKPLPADKTVLGREREATTRSLPDAITPGAAPVPAARNASGPAVCSICGARPASVGFAGADRLWVSFRSLVTRLQCM